MKETKRGEREGARVVQQQALASASAADPLRDSPRMVTQRARIDAAFGAVAQKADALEDEEPLQARMEDAAPLNETGMPNQLKAGIEALSGMDMSDVRVHRNSDKPAQLNALAYAQGNDIHLGPGQEQHLPHEAWHVVQQAQGRVRPTVQMAGAAVNDDAGLEGEADAMGAKASAGVAQLSDKPNRQGVVSVPSAEHLGRGTAGGQAVAQLAPFVGLTDDQWNVVSAAIQLALARCDYFLDDPETFSRKAADHFGVRDVAGRSYSHVVARVRGALQALARGNFRADQNFNDRYFAEVDPDDPAHGIVLGVSFWTAPAALQRNSQPGTLVHELTHFIDVLGTDDHAYGNAANVGNPVGISSVGGRNNADTWEYLFETPP